ncbi:polysaccharide deacetylase family protein [Tessaracoccus sp. MC1865]|uniref:polysaccharide deacetylase family protein n=1 Tax=Tessaracoccus sp. MC1865 TaxID=2760310 RepID=UPI001AE836FB|nr:polysaccharide deacetylase family protein [Tessaracoccus sp. MC1865]QTO37973.1 polysaccharide deacetylase family protein [Tessaracoccus sp. MC1865]
MTIRRRAALSLGALAVVGCAPIMNPARPPVAPPAPQPSPSLRPTPAEPAATPAHTAPTTPAPSPSPTPSRPGRGDIVARFQGQSPTQWGLEVDGVVLRHEQAPVVLTFDACGGRHGSGVDEDLLAALSDTGTPATLFVNARWVEANPGTVRDLIAEPLFELANHGTRHLPLSVEGEEAYGIPGTGSVAEVYDEVMGAQELLTGLLGEAPRFFRSGTAHYDDVAVAIAQTLGLQCINFDVNTDAGATFSASQVRAATLQARAGSICLGHFNRPGSGTAEGIRRAIPELLDRGLTFARLGDVLP